MAMQHRRSACAHNSKYHASTFYFVVFLRLTGFGTVRLEQCRECIDSQFFAFSAESIKRSPDKNTGEVLKRAPGTSVQDGKYLVVRGLADRYNQAMLNGVLLSSTEPDRKTFSFDLFPAAVIDNIIVNKTFIPELPGEWAGGRR